MPVQKQKKPQTKISTGQLSMDRILDLMLLRYPELSNQLQKAAKFMMDNPNEVGVTSMRQIAARAKINPNTFVRLATALGFESYESLREPFRESLRRGVEIYPDRARWLQHLAQDHAQGQLFSMLASTCMSNIETLFSSVSPKNIELAATFINKSKTAYFVGTGNCYSVMHSFFYAARMAIDNAVFVPQQSSLPMDDLDAIGKDDVLFAATYQPYRRETVEATRMAKEAGAKIICLTDSRTSPIAPFADLLFVAPTTTPQFFPSTIAIHALLETLLAFLIAGSSTNAVKKIERINRRRYEAGIYWTAGQL